MTQPIDKRLQGKVSYLQLVPPLFINGFVITYTSGVQYEKKPYNCVTSVQCTIVLVIINILAIYGLWKSSEIVYYQIMQLSELFLNDFVCSYLRFSAGLV